MKNRKQSKNLKGWQLLLIGDVFVLMGALLGISAFLGASVTIIGQVFIVVALITGTVSLIKKEKSDNPTFTVAMTILGVILFILFTSIATFVIK